MLDLGIRAAKHRVREAILNPYCHLRPEMQNQTSNLRVLTHSVAFISHTKCLGHQSAYQHMNISLAAVRMRWWATGLYVHFLFRSTCLPWIPCLWICGVRFRMELNPKPSRLPPCGYPLSKPKVRRYGETLWNRDLMCLAECPTSRPYCISPKNVSSDKAKRTLPKSGFRTASLNLQISVVESCSTLETACCLVGSCFLRWTQCCCREAWGSARFCVQSIA